MEFRLLVGYSSHMRTPGRSRAANTTDARIAASSTVPIVEATFSVTELTLSIGRAVGRAFSEEVWVEGEIRDLARARNGHVYFTLVDPDASGEATAVIPVTLFASDRDAVNRVLVRSGAMRMSDGVHVRIRGRVGYYAARGTVQLRMSWIDTDYTIGKLAAERRALLERLAAADMLDRNATLPLPLVPLRVGLVTSVGSAAHADFIAELSRNAYAFFVLVADARTQGPTAAASLVSALRDLAPHQPDVVAVVRGGGAQTDLVAFDDESLARAIATAPFPVFTGVGHEIDTSVADHVAARSFKTPTACASAIVSTVRTFEEALGGFARRTAIASVTGTDQAGRVIDGRVGRLGTAARFHVTRHRRHVESALASIEHIAPLAMDRAVSQGAAVAGRVRSAVRHRLAQDESRLAVASTRTSRLSRRGLVDAERRLDALAAIRRIHDPYRLLERGWSLTYGPAGRLVRAPQDVASGDRIRTQTAGGEIGSVVEPGGDRRDG